MPRQWRLFARAEPGHCPGKAKARAFYARAMPLLCPCKQAPPRQSSSSHLSRTPSGGSPGGSTPGRGSPPFNAEVGARRFSPTGSRIVDHDLTIGAAAIERIARRVVELLREEAPAPRRTRLLDAAELATELNVERDWIYAHADDLGAIRLGGRHGRLRFDLEAVWVALERGSAGPRSRVPRRQRRVVSAPEPRLRSSEKQRRASGSAPAHRLSNNTGR